MSRRYVMLGIPGAGKGTQARMLAGELQIPHISTGDIFRDAARSGSELGERARDIMASGGLVPDEIVVGIVKERLSQDDALNGYILDGFPRTVGQAEELDRIQSPDAVIYVRIPGSEAVRRLKSRRSCHGCSSHFNLYLDSITGGSCPECGGNLVQREDDAEETVRVRIDTYERQTEPLISYYSNKGLLREIDGNRSVEAIYEDIKKNLDI